MMSKPKVLVVGVNPWIDDTGINTLINFFECWDKDNLAHVYTRAGLPNTKICHNFFRISEVKVVKSFLNRKIKTGEVVVNTPVKKNRQDKIYKKKNNSLKNLIREIVWKFGKWKTKEFDKFIDEFNPDVLFFPVYSNVFMCRIQNYIAKRTSKPIVLYSSDDNYSYKSVSKSPFSVIHRAWLRRQERKLFNRADKIMVISPRQKEEYDKLFKKECVVLTKGVDFDKFPYKPKRVNNPIKMVYTGKLIIGRWKSLAAIAEVLGEINKDGLKVELDIYTTDILTSKQNKLLNRNGCMVKGALSLSKVQSVQESADVLVFVESLDKRYKNTARLSFSTKITDYLKSGKCIFAIGDKDIAPMDYFARFDCAVAVNTYKEIAEKLSDLITDTDRIIEYGKKAYSVAKLNHDKNRVNEILIQTITNLKEGK